MKKKDNGNITIGESHTVSFEDKISVDIRIQYKGKSSVKKNKTPLFEFKGGQEYSYSKGKYIDRNYHIDRLNDKYTESIIDRETGETILKKDEKLSKHKGHGSAKK